MTLPQAQPQPAECQCDPPRPEASRLHGWYCRRCLLACPPPAAKDGSRGAPKRPRLPMPKPYPVMISYYVDPAEFTPDPDQLDSVEALLQHNRLHNAHRGTAAEVMMLLYYLGWRPGAAPNRTEDTGAKCAAAKEWR